MLGVPALENQRVARFRPADVGAGIDLRQQIEHNAIKHYLRKYRSVSHAGRALQSDAIREGCRQR